MFELRPSHTMNVLLLTYLPPLCLWPMLEAFLLALLLSDPPFSLTLLGTVSVLPRGFSSVSPSSCLVLWRFSQMQCSGVRGSWPEQNHFMEP